MTRRVDDRGSTCAEYAVGVVAACGFAALLWRAQELVRGWLVEVLHLTVLHLGWSWL
jgi:hypothetical protein